MEDIKNREETAYYSWMNGNYPKAAELYFRAISDRPEVKINYWYLGLMLLLQGQEEEAHATWLMGILASEAEVEKTTEELVRVLEGEARRQAQLGEDSVAWLIRQHIREVAPTNIKNLLELIQLAIALDKLTEEYFRNWQVIELLKEKPPESLDSNDLLTVLQKLLDWDPLQSSSLEFAQVCLPHLAFSHVFYDMLMGAALQTAYSMGKPEVAVSLGELCLRGNPPNYGEILQYLTGFYDYAGNYSKAIKTAKQCYGLCEALPEKIFANHQLVRALLGAAGYWEEACTALQQQELLLSSLIAEPPEVLELARAKRLLSASFFFPNLRDEPKKNRKIQNRVACLVQNYVQQAGQDKVNQYKQVLALRKKSWLDPRKLKIGYLSHCLRAHSVGWLARWLLNYHDRSRFEIYGYFINVNPQSDPLQKWYLNSVDRARTVGSDSWAIAEQIAQDEIDILVDLDSLTLDATFTVMGLKPAPIQATWLGWDASGIPAIDYFIADPYVLPEAAEDYYAEKIWRLPQTYIAVDGFEIGIPTLRREELEIPPDAVIYFSGQKGYKRHLDTARLQMKIIKSVPNSYFLLKSRADTDAEQNFFAQLAEEEGVSSSRLRFLPTDPTSDIHRANLEIADVVLDTYPYNGATTTMETLWMGIPLVTRVGEQFSARNSYTMMVNAGISEGIAWSDREYVEWGIRLGLDANLRQEISWKLRLNRETAPLWNAQQFTREMESAYEQMWYRYIES